MCLGVREGEHCRCCMNFVGCVICAIILSAAWIPSSGGVPVRAHQGAAGSVGRLLREDGGIQTVLVVSNDGHPDHFASVQAAVDAVPMWNYLRWVIYIKPGVYYGTVVVPEGKVWASIARIFAAPNWITTFSFAVGLFCFLGLPYITGFLVL